MICAFAAFFYACRLTLFGVLSLFFRDFPTCKPFLLTFATLVLSSFDFFVTKVVFRAYIYMPLAVHIFLYFALGLENYGG